MSKTRFAVTTVIGLVITLAATQTASALCREGRRVIMVHNSDIRLEAGVTTVVPITVMSFDIPVPAQPLPADCGIAAKSQLPGLSVVSSYGPTPPIVNPPGVWTPIGPSTSPPPGIQPPFHRQFHGIDMFSVRFDGTAPAGTQGHIVLAVSGSDSNANAMATIGVVNVYVAQPTSPSTWFLAISTTSNVNGHTMKLNHSLLNGNPGAKLFVTHVYNPPGVTPRFWNQPLLTFYDGTRWRIANANGTPMPAGLGFNVRIDSSASQYYTGHPENHPPVPFVEIKDPIADGNPYATIAVGMTSGRATNPHPVAVVYQGSRWRIINSDGALIPAGVRFNVRVLGYSAYHDSFQGMRLDDFLSNGAGVSVKDFWPTDTRLLSFWWQLGKPSLRMVVTPNATPMGESGWAGGKYVGLKYIGGDKHKWSVIHEDQSNIPGNAGFNIVADPQPLIR